MSIAVGAFMRVILIAVGIALTIAIMCYLISVPRLLREIKDELKNKGE